MFKWFFLTNPQAAFILKLGPNRRILLALWKEKWFGGRGNKFCSTPSSTELTACYNPSIMLGARWRQGVGMNKAGFLPSSRSWAYRHINRWWLQFSVTGVTREISSGHCGSTKQGHLTLRGMGWGWGWGKAPRRLRSGRNLGDKARNTGEKKVIKIEGIKRLLISSVVIAEWVKVPFFLYL